MSDAEGLWPVQGEAHAYLLGLIAGGFVALKQSSLELRAESGAKRIARLFEQLTAGRVDLRDGRLRVRAKRLCQDLAQAGLSAETNSWRMPELSEALGHAFVRGLFDIAGHVPDYSEEHELSCSLSVMPSLREPLAARYPGAVSQSTGARATMVWRGVNALDLLGCLYDQAGLYRRRRRRTYLLWASTLPVQRRHPSGLTFWWRACDAEARPPFKARVSDSGYDLTLIREVRRHGVVVLYGTGIQVAPPAGWYFDVVPRSSIIKSGYLLANSVGVIDRSYRGEVMVPLIKIDPEAPELPLPARVVQMVPRPIVHLSPEETDVPEMTARGAGGFGSTGS